MVQNNGTLGSSRATCSVWAMGMCYYGFTRIYASVTAYHRHLHMKLCENMRKLTEQLNKLGMNALPVIKKQHRSKTCLDDPFSTQMCHELNAACKPRAQSQTRPQTLHQKPTVTIYSFWTLPMFVSHHSQRRIISCDLKCNYLVWQCQTDSLFFIHEHSIAPTWCFWCTKCVCCSNVGLAWVFVDWVLKSFLIRIHNWSKTQNISSGE